jgi:hypothetical protein
MAKSGLSINRLRELARDGAAATLKELRADIAAIERTFPELALAKGRKRAQKAITATNKRARKMSAAARRAVSRRMKRYWSERRRAKARLK